MAMKYKFDVLDALKSAGYSTYRIRREKILAESTMQKFREGKPVSTDNIGTLCALLGVRMSNLLKWPTAPFIYALVHA